MIEVRNDKNVGHQISTMIMYDNVNSLHYHQNQKYIIILISTQLKGGINLKPSMWKTS